MWLGTITGCVTTTDRLKSSTNAKWNSTRPRKPRKLDNIKVVQLYCYFTNIKVCNDAI